MRNVTFLTLLVLGSAIPVLAVTEEEAADFFQDKCASCHTIGGGPLTGPDLKDVTKRKERAWLSNFIRNPEAVLASGDPYALELQREARGAVMPTVSGLTPEMAEALLDLIEAESAKSESRFKGVGDIDKPVLPSHIQAGYDYFTGARALANGGPSCISCHSIGRIRGFGGGRLGPSLDEAFGRIGGKKALAAWLSAPPSATMAPIYKDHPLTNDEVFALMAFLKDAADRAAQEGTDEPPRTLAFFFSGVVLAGVLLGGADLAWRRRFRAVRRPLVEGKENE